MRAKERLTAPAYVPLQAFTTAAILHDIYATATPETVVSRAKDRGLTAIALTNPNFFDLGAFMAAGEKHDMRTIPGLTLDIHVPDRENPVQVTALAANKAGLDFLFQLATQVLAYELKLTPESLSDRKRGEDVLIYWHDYTGYMADSGDDGENFYALDRPTAGIDTTAFRKLHASHEDRFVLMHPVTMSSPKEAFLHQILSRTRGPSRRYPDLHQVLHQSIKSPIEIASLYPQFHDAIERTADHAQQCSVQLPKRPETKAHIAGDTSSDVVLTRFVHQALEQNQLRSIDREKLRQRVDHELSLMCSLGYADYILICLEIAQYCDENQIEFMVSGSANNSVVLWLLGIVKVDPQSFLFERFINAERGDSMPDVDFLLARSDVARVMSHFSRVYGKDAVRLCVITHLGKDRLIEMANAANQPLSDEELDIAELARIPGIISTHASAQVLAPDAPLVRTGSGTLVSQWDATAAEKFWHVWKFDYLSSRAIAHIGSTIAILHAHGITPSLPPDDESIIDSLLRGQTTAVVFCDTPHLQQVLRDVGNGTDEKTLQTITNALALARLDYAARERYVGDHYLHHPFANYPEIRSILEKTRYTAIFQDQLLELATDVIGLSWKDADTLRKLMSEKVPWNIKKNTLGQLSKFLENRKYPPAIINLLQEEIAHFTGYNFVEGHAFALAYLSYVQASLSELYPPYFWAGVFTNSLELASKTSPSFGTQVYIDEFLRRHHAFVFPEKLSQHTDVFNAEKRLLIPGAQLFGNHRPQKKVELYQQLRHLLARGADASELIRFQQENFPVVLTHNPIEQFPEEYAFDAAKSRQTIIGKVVLRRKLEQSLYLTIDGTSLINCVVHTDVLDRQSLTMDQTLHRNTFYRIDIGASASRPDQWVILYVHPTLLPQ